MYDLFGPRRSVEQHKAMAVFFAFWTEMHNYSQYEGIDRSVSENRISELLSDPSSIVSLIGQLLPDDSPESIARITKSLTRRAGGWRGVALSGGQTPKKKK